MLPPRLLRLAPLLFAVLLTLPALAQDASARLDSVAAAQPVAGRPFALDLPAGADTVVVIYRPGSAIAEADTLFAEGASPFPWTPRQAGAVRVEAGGTARTLSVRFDDPPLLGITIMLLAGLILFGGAVYATRKLLADGPPEIEPERRPDT